MTDSSKYKIFLETDCIPEHTMFDYIDKKLSSKESHSVEKHMLHCELCSDALEGLELTKNRELINDINLKISERIATPITESGKIVFYYKIIASVAASILLLIGGLFFFNQFSQKQEIAEFKHEPVQTLSTPPPPPPETPNEKRPMDAVNSVASGASIERGKLETKDGFRSDKKADQEQQLAFAADKSPLPDYKTRASEGAGTSEIVINDRRESVQAEESVNGIAIMPEQSRYESPKKELAQQAKDDDNLDEMEKSVELGGISNNENLKLAETTSKAISGAPAGGKNELAGDVKREEAKKYNKNDNLARNESKATKQAAKENTGQDISMYSPAAPQSATTTAESYVTESDAFTVSADQQPQFPGGQDSLLIFIHKNFKYPENFDVKTLTSNKIIVTFIVNTKGEIRKAKILKGINSELDNEALRVLSIMPKWKTGSNNGDPIAKQVTLPIQLK